MPSSAVQAAINFADRIQIEIPPNRLRGYLQLPPQDANGVIVFAHGYGSNRESPRNAYVAQVLQRKGFATVVFDLLREDETEDRIKMLDITLLATRVVDCCKWVLSEDHIATLPLGLFGASTGAAAALEAAANLGNQVCALVCRGGRPDLAANLEGVRHPTLLIVGGRDYNLVGLNRAALAVLDGPKALQIVPEAAHLFSEPGALDVVATATAEWFAQHCRLRPEERDQTFLR